MKTSARTGIRQRSLKVVVTCLVLTALVFVLALLELCLGKSVYTPGEVLVVLAGQGVKSANYTILEIRLPRVLAALFAGMAFGLAGAALQRLLKNPLASPDVIGVSAGASTAAVFAILILHLSGWTVSIFALASGLAVTLLIYWLAHGQGYHDARLILIGIGMQAFLNALISWMLQIASEYNVSSAMRWLAGSLGSVTLDQIPFLAWSTVILGVLLMFDRRHLQIMELSDAFATTLGAAPAVSRLILLVLSVSLVAFATSVTGPMASVAFLSGPIASRLCKTGPAPLIAAGLVGIIMILAGDFAGQYLLPARYPAGIITGMIGAPYLLMLLVSMQKKG